ncbi:apolipoprotein N-acyltransferase [Sulfurimonas sp.]|nr:apolipoprotein N-acyltransferase [Sulfurimonas sp.]
MLKNIYKPDITYPAIIALLFSSFIYLEHFGITCKILNTVFALISLYLFLHVSKKAVLLSGFLIGLLWFYWVGYSFEYNGVGFLTPFVTLGFALLITLFFAALAFTKEVYIRALLLFILSFVEPFDFNWMQIELIFVDSYIGVQKYQLVLVLIALALPTYIKKPYMYASLLLILLAVNYSPKEQKDSPLKIKLVETKIAQDIKWTRQHLEPTIKLIYQEIEKAKQEKYEVVVLPESVFPLFMNRAPRIIQQLQLLSYDITIIAGTLLYEDEKNYNVTYMFNKGNYEIAKKLVLVPFGEYIPLPKFMRKVINEYFFAGASDFKTATHPTDFTIEGTKFRNAICFEATCQEVYEGDVDFIIASSNNAWFTPSIEPTLQKLLLRFYARKNGVTVYHSANWAGTGVIK